MKKRITNVKIFPISSEPFEGELLFDESSIIEVGPKVQGTAEETLDGKGGLLMPGFIDGHSHIGLMPEGYGWEYDDVNEYSDPVTADVRCMDAFVPTDMGIEESARGGVMMYCVLPGSANPVGGLGFIAKYTRSNLLEDKVIRADCGLKMATGENPKRVYQEYKKMPVTRMGTAAVMRKFFFDGLNYMQKKEKAEKEGKPFSETDLKMEVAQLVLEKEIPARIHCHRAEDMLTAIRIKKEFDINIVIEHATELIKVADELKQNEIPVFLGPYMGSRPKVELREMTYRTYGAAEKAGILFGCMSDHPVFPAEVLRIQAGLGVQYGASEKAMLESLTINPAKILQLEESYGTLEEGKVPMMCLWDGHPFDARSRVVWNNVDGWLSR